MMGQELLIPSDLPFEAKLFIMTFFSPRTKDATRLLKHIFVREEEGYKITQPSPVDDNIEANIAQLANFVKSIVPKTQSIRVPAAVQIMPNKTIIA
ncbi:unnamed protein product [Eruca vesicaria subsp. sativa]|uniref:Uncharacterized protein n=1 Tax=Eruca vesicaria subsp. sativa TaxID=29727 RepID=A0ABC8J9F0_ERUVS|nr:unnamed protein product [Eruca vesicaria subsp. sativa]